MRNETASPSPYLTTPEAAAYLRLSAPTLNRWRGTGVGPRFLRSGRRVLYSVADLDRWLASRAVETGEAGELDAAPASRRRRARARARDRGSAA